MIQNALISNFIARKIYKFIHFQHNRYKDTDTKGFNLFLHVREWLRVPSSFLHAGRRTRSSLEAAEVRLSWVASRNVPRGLLVYLQ